METNAVTYTNNPDIIQKRKDGCSYYYIWMTRSMIYTNHHCHREQGLEMHTWRGPLTSWSRLRGDLFIRSNWRLNMGIIYWQAPLNSYHLPCFCDDFSKEFPKLRLIRVWAHWRMMKHLLLPMLRYPHTTSQVVTLWGCPSPCLWAHSTSQKHSK